MNLRYPKKMTILVKAASLFLCVICAPASIATDEEREVLPNYVFTPTKKPILQAEAALSKALAEHKYALIVLGAQWCHDSVGLAENFSTNEMQTVLAERYVTQFIDVAYLEDRRDITNLVGYPNYFATPTVLIVDPVSNTVMNMDSLKEWQSADSVDLQIYIEQFSRFNQEDTPLKPALKNNMLRLDAFETQQSERLQKGYSVLGPLLAASDVEEGSKMTGKEREQFLTLWRQVKKFRTHLQASIHELRGTEFDDSELPQKLVDATQKVQSWEQSVLED
nr:thioredoxin family protein [uncultured Glaciecola sp.]